MGRRTADHGSQTEDGVISRRSREPLCDDRDLERAWYPGHIDILLPNAVPDQAIHGAGEEPGGDKLVEPRDHDRKTEPLANQVSLEASSHLLSSPLAEQSVRSNRPIRWTGRAGAPSSSASFPGIDDYIHSARRPA